MDQVIKTTGLCHRYDGKISVLENISLCVERGSVYGFLGPNGSGKTTTLRLLLGLLNVQQGSIELFGHDLARHRRDILARTGNLIETPSLYGNLTARENLQLYDRIYGAPRSRINEVLAMVGIADTGRKKAKSFSLGMKQRLSVALALLPAPELLVLDEPSNGLDPTGIIELRELVRTLNQQYGMTILMSSHILAEMEKMVSHVGIISHGKMVFQGSLPELKQLQKQHSVLHLKTSDNLKAAALLSEFSPEHLDGRLLVPYRDEQHIAELVSLLSRHLDIYLVQPEHNDLEQLFINLTT